MQLMGCTSISTNKYGYTNTQRQTEREREREREREIQLTVNYSSSLGVTKNVPKSMRIKFSKFLRCVSKTQVAGED